MWWRCFAWGEICGIAAWLLARVVPTKVGIHLCGFSVFLPGLLDGVGMCPRQGSPFSLRAQRKGTKRKGTLARRSVLGTDCSAVLGRCGSRPTHYASVARCVQTGGAKSVNEARCARTRKALRSSTAHKGPKSNAVVASQLPNQHLAAHRRDFRSQQMFGAARWHGFTSARSCSRSGTARWRAPLLWLLSFGATNVRAAGVRSLRAAKLCEHQSNSPAGATTRRTRWKYEEQPTRQRHQWIPACAGMTSTQETPHV